MPVKGSRRMLKLLENSWVIENVERLIESKKEEIKMKKKFMRSGRIKKIGGVCAGLANYLILLQLYVWFRGVLAFCYGAGLIAYLILWAIAPVSGEF